MSTRFFCYSLSSVMLALGLAAQAATITVDTTADEINSDGNCSLREAISSANTDTAVSGCTAGSGDDVIILPSATYSIDRPGDGEDANDTGDFDITGNINIAGAGATSTILSTNKGLLTSKEATKQKVGGEIICKVW